MSLANTIQLLTTRVAQEFNTVRAEIANSANSSYTRSEIDTALLAKADVTYVDGVVSSKAETVYVDGALSAKANVIDVYTRAETDSAISVAISNIPAGNTYSRAETDSAISTAIAAVVDAAPDGLNTLFELAAALNDDTNFASTITSSIALKANTADVDAALLTKASTSDVTTALTFKADQATTYTKTEVDNLLSPITGELSDLGNINLVALFESGLV